MFEIKNVFCQDKNVGEVLRVLAGLVVQPPVPVPLVNASVGKNGVGAASPATDIVELFATHVKKKDVVTSKDVQAFLTANGRAKGSAAYIVTRAKERRIIKATAKAGTYKVVTT